MTNLTARHCQVPGQKGGGVVAGGGGGSKGAEPAIFSKGAMDGGRE